MRPAVLLLLGLLGGVAGCIAVPADEPALYIRHTLTGQERQQIKVDLLRSLKVSDALFSSVQAAKAPSGELVVCGWVRLKSDFPEYPRYPDNRPFVVTYMHGEESLRKFRLLYFAKGKSEAPRLYTYCSRKGIPL